MLNILNDNYTGQDEATNMSFLKGADREESAMEFSNMRELSK